MGEVNEKDLEQVAGGNASGFNVREWERKNCDICVARPCESKLAAENKARREAAEGRYYRCPGQHLYPAQSQ